MYCLAVLLPLGTCHFSLFLPLISTPFLPVLDHPLPLILFQIVKDGIWRNGSEDNRQKLLSILEKYTTSERNILSDDRKKTPVRSQGRRGGERLMEQPWLQLMCCAPVSGCGVVAYFRVREVAKTEVLNRRVKESEWIRRD